jgi:hypothetical protein
MTPKIGTISIERFRAFRELKIEGLGRVNLITGCNNTGKSSMLEALRLLASGGSPAVIAEIIRYREEDMGESDEGGFQISSLFNGFPRWSDTLETLAVIAKGVERPTTLTLSFGWYTEKRNPETGERTFLPAEQRSSGEFDWVRLLVVGLGSGKKVYPLEHLRRVAEGYDLPDLGDEARMPCVFVSPYGGEGTAALGALWDKVALSELEKDVVQALQIIDPHISAVSMVGDEGPRRSRIAMARSEKLSRRVPLRTFGDGMNRLFGIAISLVNARNGLLLIDEFENGMHYSVQLKVWRTIFHLAQWLDVQVFATSHSWDAIEAFQQAAAETPEEGTLVRLVRKGEDIIPTVLHKDELKVAVRQRIEAR